ncbi:hypothetical protein [Enterococcus sp. 5H]|uniref:hypothetical protein n=1 Tax=Enterococcus sp. 5H TaxID=1229490 RepID=UPI002303B8A4|nr:hypothetical protein [Enterococcus sp. 5H]MDA9470439.1 hypothetical protein [Enterococcus sp. 5H]
MSFTRRKLKYLAVIVCTCGLIGNLFLKTVHGESLVSDATVEVVQDDTSVILEDNVKQEQLPKTNEQINSLFACLGMLLLILWARKVYNMLKILRASADR